LIKSQKTFALIAAVAVFLVDASVANANCEAQGKVNRLRTGTAVGSFVDITPLIALPPFATFFAVPVGQDFYPLLATAQASGEVVIVIGNAVSCATTGTFRPGGNVIGVDIKANIN
jgi:hypothetical protein